MPTSTFDVLATYTCPTNGVTSMSFTSITNTYLDLYIVANLQRNLAGSGGRSVQIRFNNDTNSNNYSYTRIYADGAQGGDNTFPIIFTEGQTRCCNTAWIFDYANTNLYKTAFCQNGNGTVNDNVIQGVATWKSQSAISTVTLTDGGFEGFTAGDTVALYGVKI